MSHEWFDADTEYEVLLRSRCQERSNYCYARTTSLPDGRGEVYPCEDGVFKTLHFAKCAVEVERRLITSFPDRTHEEHLLLDNIEAVAEGEAKRQLEFDLSRLIGSIDPSDISKNGWQRIYRRSAIFGRAEVMKTILMNKNIQIELENHYYAMRKASAGGHTEVMKLLLAKEEINPNDDGNRALYLASENGHVETVRLLLADERVDATDDNHGVLVPPSMNGHVKVVELLLYWKDPSGQRVDPTAQNYRALQAALTNDHTDVITILQNKISEVCRNP